MPEDALFAAIALYLVVTLIMPWVNMVRIGRLSAELERLRAQQRMPTQATDAPVNDTAEGPATIDPPRESFAPFTIPEPVVRMSEPAGNQAGSRSIEQQIGGRLPVWIGGIALALAGLFMVKYSIDTGLLSPSVRVLLGGAFGLGLTYAGQTVFRRPAIANGVRIAQSLTGAGIADLYGCLFAAASLYHLIPAWMGFTGMAGVTGFAVIASLRYGMPIALLGLAGGMVTPVLIHSAEPSAPLLFTYLYFVIAGLFAVVRQRGWWVCGGLAVAAAFGWVIAWILVDPFAIQDASWLALFLLAVSATVAVASRKAIEELPETASSSGFAIKAVNYLTMGGAALLMAMVTTIIQFDPVTWGLFACLSAGGMVLAWQKPQIYGVVPWISLALGLASVAAWQDIDQQRVAWIIAGFAALYQGGSTWIAKHTDRPVSWAALGSVAALAYYLVAYYRLHPIYSSAALGFPLWGGIAMALAALAVLAAHSANGRYEGDTRQKLLAIHAATTTAFLSLGLGIELPREFLSVAFAMEIIAVALIDTKLEVKALRFIAGALACVFGYLLLKQILLLAQLTAYSLFEIKLPLQPDIPIVRWPLFQLGLPAILFAGASLLLRRRKDDRLAETFEAVSAALLGMMGYYLTRHAFHTGQSVLFARASFIERGVITNALFVYGLGCLFLGRFFQRATILRCGMVLAGIALFRIVYFDILIYDPLWSHQFVGTLPLANALLLPFGLPILWTALADRQLSATGRTHQSPFAKLLMLVLLFVLLSLELCQMYHGGYLDIPLSFNGEVYAYSVVWLLLGLGCLLAGTLRHDRLLRSASLAIILLTIGKVFLYDASELEGLYRIFSFLGLGISLLGLSWFYTRFVFAERKP